jgi:hypothetical protein
MSTDYSVFVRSRQPVEAVVSGLEKILNCTLSYTKARKHYYSAKVFGLGISLVYPISYEDSHDEFKFSDYDFEVQVQYAGWFDKEYSHEFQRAAAVVLANMISRHLKCDSLALEDLGRILAEFVTDDDLGGNSSEEGSET